MSPVPRRDLTPFVVILVVAAVVLFLFVGGLASVGRSSGPFHASIDESFGAEARVLVAQSNSVGDSLSGVVLGTGDVLSSRPKLSQALDGLVAGADSVASGANGLASPAPEGAVARNFIEAMTQRASAVTLLRSTVDGLLRLTPGGASGSPAVPSPFPPAVVSVPQAIRSISSVGRLLMDADRSYAVARREYRAVPGGSTLPRSVWVNQPAVWGIGAVQTTVNQLSSMPSLLPLVDVRLVAIELSPPILPPAPAVNGQPRSAPLGAGVSQISPTCSVSVTAVVRNAGSIVATKVSVEASVQAVSGGPPFPVQKRVTLAPAASVALALPIMPVKPNTTYNLAVTVVAPAGQSRSTNPAGVSIEVASFGSAKDDALCARTPAAAP
jgi:hypothetical protein